MRLTPPTKNVFYFSVLLVVLGVLGEYVGISVLADFSFLLVLIGYVLLALGNTLKGF